MNTKSNIPIVGVILANSPNRKICCADKCLKKLMGKTVLEHIIERTAPQVSCLILNANGDPTRFDDLGLPVVPDALDENQSVLNGILTGMEWARQNIKDCEWIATFAADSPFVPRNLADHLLEEIVAHDADMAYVKCGKRAHPEYGLWPVDLAEDLRNALVEDEIRRVDKWTSLFETMVVEYSPDPIDRFTNANLIDAIIKDVDQSAVMH